MKQSRCTVITIALIGLGYSILFAQTPTSFEEYLKAREHLMRQDSQLYFDYADSLSTKEQLLNQKMAILQREMLQNYKDQHFFPPARNFYQSKSHIEETPLFKMLKEMPKGGILHLHSIAMGDADWIIQKSRSLPEMHIYWHKDASSNIPKGVLHAYKPNEAPKGYIPVDQLLKAEPEAYQEIRSLLVFEEEMDQDSVDISVELEMKFSRITNFISYRPVYEDYIVHGTELLIADNIQHAEFRTGFRDHLYDLEHPSGSMGIATFISALENIQKRVRAIDPEFTFHIIHCSLRFKNATTIWKEMQEVYTLKRKYPFWIRGFDLVAEEDAGNSTLYHAKEFLKLDSLETAQGTSLPLYLHDGESNWASVANLYDAVLLGTQRIGHGFNLFRFPKLLEEVKRRDICMEINPLSNQILGYVRDLRNHPASTYLRRGINCTISSDDPMIFDYHGLTYDYWSIYLAWELDLAALKRLSRNGIAYSSLTNEEKTKALATWEKRWNVFVEKMLNASEP
ncbi:MAG: hypothetical protein AAFP82_01840 [Bacteroidota bacterium]